MPFTNAGGFDRHFYYRYKISEGNYGEFDGRKIVAKTTSKSMEFAHKKWAEYLV